MVADILILVLCLGLILLSCACFVNAVEGFGKILNLHQGIIGSILAAVGTALPETIIPIIAIFFTGGENGHAIGIGAIAGAPFMLGTLGFFVTGTAVIANTILGRRGLSMSVDCGNLTRDLLFFIVYYGIAVSVTFFREITLLKWVVAIGLAGSYAFYLKITINSDCAVIEETEELYLSRFFKLPGTLFWTTCQLIASLGLIIVGAHFFVRYVGSLSNALGVSPLILSLIITPIATELPEKMNSIIWVGRKKDTLALGNITGAMVFQSCFPVAFGIVFTEWNLKGATMVSALCALLMASITVVWIKTRKSLHPFLLCTGGVLYLIFIVKVFVLC